MTEFECVTLSPLTAASGGMIRATWRAGATALVDLSPVVDPAALEVLRRTDDRGELAFRATPDQAPLLDGFAGRRQRLVLWDWSPAELPQLLAHLDRPGREIWLEVLDIGEALMVPGELPVGGWVGRGSECGGRCGRQAAFILAQALARQVRPFWIQGGIGVHSAVAARVAGAAGVVLDDALLLLREFPLPPGWRAVLADHASDDTAVLGGHLGETWRVAGHRDRGGFQRCAEAARRIEESVDAPARWRATARSHVGWGDPAKMAWPLGQLAGCAGDYARRYGTTGRLIAAVRRAVATNPAAASRRADLSPGSPLARAHGTRYPIVQGPMTRVSDVVPFAQAVAEAGALPMLALATMPGPQVNTLLEQAQADLADRPWGVGLLGYLAPELAEAQIEALARWTPSIALIAGGRPDQAKQLERLGINTYIHVPSPELLRLFLDQGARRFVFEGAECGGHTGPLNSFPLWDAMIEALSSWTGDQLHVLFAGGIHDAPSAAMVAAMAASLGPAPVQTGVLMGSAYLFTNEAVATRAIVPAFQSMVVECAETTVIETGPGHRIRCVPTPFVQEFDQLRDRLHRGACAPKEIREALEAAVVGRLRIASKGLARQGDHLVPVDPAEQQAAGLFMVGELATLHNDTYTCARLHNTVSGDSMAVLSAMACGADRAGAATPRGEAVAITGIGCLLPGATDPDALWHRLLDQADAVEEIPPERWDWRLFYDPDPAARDRMVSKWGGFIKPLPFDHLRYGIPPHALHSISAPQLLALEATARALTDAGAQDLDETTRERTAVIFGVGSGGDLDQMLKARTALPLVTAPAEESLARLPEWTEESYPGILLNVVAGRVANRFDLGGANFTVDAACASSLAALDVAVRELQSGRSDLVVAGAVDAEMSPHAYTAFSKTGALSPTGRARPFDERADGIVLSEGAVVLVLKRLADADRDGDRVYAVIRGIAGSSDGRGLGLTAPKSGGQVRAMERAYAAAGTDVGAIGFYEAHATGTRVGDRTELETLQTMLSRAGADNGRCVVGAAKSLLGHTRSAAGMVGVVKAALALHHGVLPPQGGVDRPLPPLRDPTSRLHLLSAPAPWLRDAAADRWAGVSAFGFGGTNFHAVLQAHAEEGPAGAAGWPAELFVLAASDRDAMRHKVARLARACDGLDAGGAGPTLRDAAYSCALAVAGVAGSEVRLAIVARNSAELARHLAAAEALLASDTPPSPDLYYGEGGADGDLAFLFPGQGSQSCGMGGELALFHPEMRRALAWSGVADLILPPASFTPADQALAEAALTDTRVAQPAIVAVSCGLLDMAARIGLCPARVAGHSLGEFTALHAAGALDRDDLLHLVTRRGDLMASADGDPGAMAVLALGRDAVDRYLRDGAAETWIANVNGPRQVVVAGSSAAIERLLARVKGDGHTARRLPVSGAFHSPLMRPANAAFATFLADGIRVAAPTLPVYGNLDGQPYPTLPETVRRRCAGHMESPVDFVAQIRALWQAGARTFLELGPGQALTGLVTQILEGRPHRAIAIAGGGLSGWLSALAQLWAQGHAMDLTQLFDGRPVRPVDLDQPPIAKLATDWLIDGGRVIRREGQLHGSGIMGAAPFRTADSPTTDTVSLVKDTTEGAYGEYQETMRRFLDQQERVLIRMLGQSVDPGPSVVAGDAVETGTPPPQSPWGNKAAAPTLATPDRAKLDAAALRTDILQLISDRTGYSLDALRDDQDLEADLGINSIKRIEIVGRLIGAQAPDLAGRLETAFDRLVTAKSVTGLVETILRVDRSRTTTDLWEAPMPQDPAAGEPGAAVAPQATTAREPPPAQAESNIACPRYIMQPALKPLPMIPRRRLDGLYLICVTDEVLAESLSARLRHWGATPHRLPLSPEASITGEVDQLRQHHGPVRGIVQIADANADESADAVKGLFRLLQSCVVEAESAGGQICIVCVSRLGGSWGRDGALMDRPIGVGTHGLIRSMAQEFPGILTKSVDVAADLPAETLLDHVVDETIILGGGDEVGYRAGQRFVFNPEPAPLAAGPERDWRPGPGGVVLATGGARGITFELCRELAGPDVRFVLVGRSEPALSGPLANNLETLRLTGATVEYHGLDVRNERAFGGLIDDVYRRLGRIDAVLHGAGVIEDQRLVAKTPESFDRVFDTKVGGAAILARHLRPDHLKWLVLFGSVSGRFGNSGQVDYAAANEALTRMGHWLNRRWPNTRVLTIEWGPWQGGGMAEEGVQRLLGSRGIQPIDIAAGRRFLVDELGRGRKADAEVIAGRGPWGLEPDAVLGSVFSSFSQQPAERPVDEMSDRPK